MKASTKTGEKQLSQRGTSVLSTEEFDAFKNHIIKTVQNTAKNIYNGVSEPLPITKRSPDNNQKSDIRNEFVPCTYCEYASICGNFPPLRNFRTFQTDSKETAKQKIIDGEINYEESVIKR
jgi:ATP-dependent helicase/DNAse subunit B